MWFTCLSRGGGGGVLCGKPAFRRPRSFENFSLKRERKGYKIAVGVEAVETVERLSAPAPGLIFPGKVSCGQPVAAPVERWKSTGISTPRWKTPGGKLRSLWKFMSVRKAPTWRKRLPRSLSIPPGIQKALLWEEQFLEPHRGGKNCLPAGATPPAL